jgi:thioredoxin 1
MMRLLKAGLLGSGIFCLGMAFSTPTLAAHALPSQASESAKGGSFEPLDRWKAAVLAGDKIALRGFYTSALGAFAKTPEGKSSDPLNEEPEFWSKLSSQGLHTLVPKILEQTSPQPNVVSLVLRIEMTFDSKNETRQSLVSASQVWVGQNGDWRILMTQRGNVVPLPVIRLPQPPTPNPNLYPDPGEAHKDLDAALASARSDRKRVLVVFGANWCYDCHVLDTTFRSKNVAPLVAANYRVVHINIGDGDSNADLAERFGVPLRKGIPSLAVLDGDGRLITSQKQGEFESAAKIGLSDVIQFLDRWKPTGQK